MRTQKNRIVIVLTNHSDLGDTGKKTGYHLEELAVPYLEFKRAGAEIVIASPKGGQPPVDPKSAEKDSPAIQQFLDDPEAQRRMKNTIKVGDVEGTIDALFFPGGQGPMWDLASSSDVTDLVEHVWLDGGIVAAVCHGPAALINANAEDGRPLVAGKRVNSFTDAEERAGGLFDVVPFHLEEKLRSLGAKFEHSGKQQAHVAVDGRLITGQNPASAKGVAQAVLLELERAPSQFDEAGIRSLEPQGEDDDMGQRLESENRPANQDERTSFDNGNNMKTVRAPGSVNVENVDGDRASNGRVISTTEVSTDIASRYDTTGARGEAQAAPAPDNADDFLPSGMTADSHSSPNTRRSEPIKGRGTMKLDEDAPAAAVLHDDAPPEKRAQAKRTKKQEMGKADAANAGSRAAHKNSPPTRNTRR